jgi:hypothetical protein
MQAGPQIGGGIAVQIEAAAMQDFLLAALGVPGLLGRALGLLAEPASFS